MESAGFAYFCDESQVHWMIIRGIADYGQSRRTKDWQYVATLAAAHVLRAFLMDGLIEIPGR
jgi:nucleoside phosphorylase